MFNVLSPKGMFWGIGFWDFFRSIRLIRAIRNCPVIILGIDPGIARTGWGVLSRGSGGILTLVGYGCLETDPGLEASVRLLFIFREINRLIDEYRPDLAGVEKLFFNTNALTAMEVGEAKGVAMLALARVGVKIEEFTPLQIKQAVAGYGRAEKTQVQKMVKTLLHLTKVPKPDDAADALAVAITASTFRKL
jgi:crossover junction endodeoxyribonuclease RuvC